MLRLVQGTADRSVEILGRKFPHAGVAMFFCLLLAGCGAGGLTVENAAPDRSIQTGSLSPDREGSEDRQAISDRITIQNAVSSADLARMEDGVAWANAETGNSGLVVVIQEHKADGVLCRIFTTRKESYDGVALYKGETCMGRDGNWHMRMLEPV